GRKLRRGRSRADDADALAVERDAVIPAGRVEDGTFERLDTLEPGDVHVMQHAGGGDDEIVPAFVPIRALEVPGTVAIAELRDLAVEARAFEHAEVPRDTLEVGANVLAFGHQRVPFRVAGEGVGVPVRRHIASEARIGILPPSAADAVAFLEDIAFDAAV